MRAAWALLRRMASDGPGRLALMAGVVGVAGDACLVVTGNWALLALAVALPGTLLAAGEVLIRRRYPATDVLRERPGR